MKVHHANIVIGNDGPDKVLRLLNEEFTFSTQGNPDFFMMETEVFGIDDARDLGRWVAGKPLAGDIKAALFVVDSITLEAQNALLKILEEPPFGTHIFINLKNLGGIIPTFLSRVVVLKSEDDEISSNKLGASRFLKDKIKDRLTVVRSLIKKEDKIAMKEFFEDIERPLRKDVISEISEAEDLKRVLKAKIFASAKGSSRKMLLEWLACSVSH